MIHINALEVAWISINVVAAALTIAALIEARRDWAILRVFNGSARGVVARAAVRRETFRLGSQVALLAVALPSLFSDREVVLTPGLVALLCVPVLVLANTISDRTMRRQLAHKIEEDIELERDASLARMEAQGDRLEVAMAENTRVSQEASDHADHAFKEANSVNEKIAAQGDVLIAQGTVQEEFGHLGRDTNETAHRIDERMQ